MLAKPLHICIIAGEPSGDALGASLIGALKKHHGIIFSGIGGPTMQAEGLQTLFPMEDLAVMGIAEIAPRLALILGRIDETARYIEQARPDIVVTIDAPDFCFRVLKKVRAAMEDRAPKLIHYVAPTVWAWRAGRARKIAQFLDGLICLFDFEPPYFEAEGLRATAIGHPVVETDAMKANGLAFREKHRIPAETRTAGILFGSRRGELKRHGRLFRDVMAALPGGTHFIIPTLPHLRTSVEEILADLDAPYTITDDRDDKWNAFAACNTALAVSGTVGLELAVARVPHVIAYRMNEMTYQLVRHLVKVRYAHLLNIMLDDAIIPEFIQHQCTVQNVAETMTGLMTDDSPRQMQMTAFDIFAARIGAHDETPPSEKAAQFILSYSR